MSELPDPKNTLLGEALKGVTSAHKDVTGRIHGHSAAETARREARFARLKAESGLLAINGGVSKT